MAGPLPVRVLRGRVGLTGGRNRMAAAAVGEFVLFLDDDTVMLSSESIESAIAVMDADPSVGAVAFAQAESGGQPWPAHMQPSPADRPVVVPAFIGFGHLVRRSMLLKLSGFRERFDCYGEEKEFCLRLLNAGYKTVYLPQALIAHVPDPRSRDMRRYLRLVARNDCLNTLYNDPLARVMWMLPARVALYFRMRRAWKVSDRWRRRLADPGAPAPAAGGLAGSTAGLPNDARTLQGASPVAGALCNARGPDGSVPCRVSAGS